MTADLAVLDDDLGTGGDEELDGDDVDHCSRSSLLLRKLPTFPRHDGGKT